MGPGEENSVESDTEEEEILEERVASPLRIRIPGARGRGGPPAAAIPDPIDTNMRWLNIIVKLPHLADLEIESMKKFILDYKRCKISTTIATENAAIYSRGAIRGHL